MKRLTIALALALLAAPASAQVQEAFALASANVSAGPTPVFGGTYILNQTCASYGTVTFQALGPDGAAFQTAASYTSSTSTGGGRGQAGLPPGGAGDTGRNHWLRGQAGAGAGMNRRLGPATGIVIGLGLSAAIYALIVAVVW